MITLNNALEGKLSHSSDDIFQEKLYRLTCSPELYHEQLFWINPINQYKFSQPHGDNKHFMFIIVIV